MTEENAARIYKKVVQAMLNNKETKLLATQKPSFLWLKLKGMPLQSKI